MHMGSIYQMETRIPIALLISKSYCPMLLRDFIAVGRSTCILDDLSLDCRHHPLGLDVPL